MPMVPLRSQRLGVMLRPVFFLLACGPRFDSARAVESNVSVIHDDCLAVNVGHVPHVDVHHGAVVEECAASPLAAGEADAAAAEAVVNSAGAADVRSPIASVPAVKAALKAPIAGRPEQADRCDQPCAGNPVVAVIVTPCPIAVFC